MSGKLNGRVALPTRIAGWAIVIGLVGMLSACVWPTFGADLSNSRSNPSENAIGPSNVASLTESWRSDGAEGVTSTPIVVGNSVYFGTWTSELRAVDKTTGLTQWTTSTPDIVDATPAVVNGRVLVGDATGNFMAVDAFSGDLLWSRELDNHPNAHIYSSANVHDGIIVIGVGSNELVELKADYTFTGSVVALDLDGRELWRTYVTNDDAQGGAGGSVWSSAAIDPERRIAYIGTGQSYEEPASRLTDSLLALNLDTGAILWSRQFTEGDVFTFWNPEGPDADIGASPNLFTIGGRDVVGVGDKAAHYAVFDRATGETIWTVDFGQSSNLGGIMTTSAVADGRIYVNSNIWGPNQLDFNDPAHRSITRALDAATGRVLWSRNLPSPAFGAMAEANGVVYQSSVKGLVYALDGATGNILWSREPNPSADLGGGVSIADGTVYVGYGFWFLGRPGIFPQGGVVAYRLPG